MAGPVIEFDEVRRNRLARFVAICHWVCILPSFICLVTALYVQLLIEDKIAFIEDYNGAVLPGLLIFAGLFGFLGHILCGKAAFSNRKPEKREKWLVCLIPALVATIVIFLAEFVAGIMCFVHTNGMEESFDKGIRSAMDAYKNDATAKEQMDVLQMTYECCGSKTYSDWFYLRWIHPDYMNPLKAKINNYQQSLSLGNEETFVDDNVPFSCCSPNVLRPCIDHHVHDNDLHYNYNYRESTTLHSEGCTTKLMSFYENSILTVFSALVLGLSFIQFVNLISLRFLQTSVSSVMDSDDPEGLSIGYLFGAPPTMQGPDTTMTSTVADSTLLDTTGDTTLSQETAETGVDRYVQDPNAEPIYENIPPFEPGFEDEHIYNEGEVEEYLAAKYADNKEKFEPGQGDNYDYVGGQPIYENIGGNAHRPKTSLTKVRSDYGNYMAMNISNSSWSPRHQQQHAYAVPNRHRRHRKDPRVKRHSMPSPEFQTSSPIDTYVINMANMSSPKLEKTFSRQKNKSPERNYKSHRSFSTESKSFFGTQRNVSPERAHLLERHEQSCPELYFKTASRRHSSADNIRHNQQTTGFFSPVDRTNQMQPGGYRDRSPIMRTFQRTSSKTLSPQTYIPPNISPPRMPSAKRVNTVKSSPVLLAALSNRRSPSRRGSPQHRVSPEKRRFKTGVSYGCNHAYD